MASTKVNSAVSFFRQTSGSTQRNTISGSDDSTASFKSVLEQIGVAAENLSQSLSGSASENLSKTSNTTLNTISGTRTDSRADSSFYRNGTTKTDRTENDDSQSATSSVNESQTRTDNNGKTDRTDNASSKQTNVTDDHDKTSSAQNDDASTTASTKTSDSDTVTDAAGEADDEADDEIAEDIATQLLQLIETIADKMGVSTEQVLSTLKENGISASSLLNPDSDSMAKLVASLGSTDGSTSTSSILTDESLYNDLSELKQNAAETLTEISSETGISEDQLKQMISESQQRMSDGNDAQNLNQQVLGGDDAQNLNQQSLAGMNDYVSKESQSDGKQIEVEVSVDDKSGLKTFSVTEQTVQNSGNDNSNENGSLGNNGASSNRSENSTDSLTQNVNASDVSAAFADNLSKLMNFTSSASSSASSSQTTASQAQDIFDQIADYMKVQVKSDTTSLDIRLHPESLGTVNVHLTEKQGALTAEFTTQNEAVKAAVESQMVQLKQQFEEQGIKVDAVEVSVAEQKYGNGGQSEEKDSEETQQSSKVRSRKIDLTGEDGTDDIEDLDESDRITADMMARNGNKIDYTA